MAHLIVALMLTIITIVTLRADTLDFETGQGFFSRFLLFILWTVWLGWFIYAVVNGYDIVVQQQNHIS